ncbi:MAG: hypothetical protein ABIS43_17645 [Opitutus sp.]
MSYISAYTSVAESRDNTIAPIQFSRRVPLEQSEYRGSVHAASLAVEELPAQACEPDKT